MKTRSPLKAAAALAVVLLVGLAAVLAQKKSSDDAEFKATVRDYYTAWNTLDTNNPAKYYARDADLIFFDVAPLQYHGWDEYRAGVQKYFFEPMVSARLTPNDDLKVTRLGPDAVMTTLTFHLAAKPKAGGAIDLDCRHTAIWQRRGGKWLIIHEHISTPLPG